MSDFDKYLKEEKKKRDRAEINGYAKGMVASAILVVLASFVTGAFSDNPLSILIISICAAFVCLPCYWMFGALLRLDSNEPVWWHLPAALMGMVIVATMLGNIFGS